MSVNRHKHIDMMFRLCMMLEHLSIKWTKCFVIIEYIDRREDKWRHQ